MAGLKTQPTTASVSTFLNAIEDESKRADCKTLVKIMRAATGARPQLWGTSIVGFGSYHYTYSSGREGDWFEVGFAPRKRELTLYIMAGFSGYSALLRKLGKHKTGKSCLYIKRLADVDMDVLRELVERGVQQVRHTHA